MAQAMSAQFMSAVFVFEATTVLYSSVVQWVFVLRNHFPAS